MKKTTIAMLFLLCSIRTFSQDVKRSIGLGLQSSFPLYGISAKYAFTEQSVVQATIAPFGASAGSVGYSVNFFGARYIHRFIKESESNVIFDPYLYAGTGMVVWKLKYGSLGSSSSSFLSYSVGGGVEMIAGKCFGISGEVGYGRLGFSNGIALTSMHIGGGLHYYIR